MGNIEFPTDFKIEW